MTRDDIASVLDEIALLLELKGDNPFKIRAYKQGAETVRSYVGDIFHLAATNQLDGIKGIGEALRDKLHELATTGTLAFHQQLSAEFQPGIFELFDIPGLGPAKIKSLHQSIGISSIAGLEAACRDGRVAALPGFGATSQQKILASIVSRRAFADTFRLGDVAPLAEFLLEAIRSHPETLRAAAAGSYRRSKETVHDLDFVAATTDPRGLLEDFISLPGVREVIAAGDTKASVRLEHGIQCDLRTVTNRQFPFTLQYFTGSKEHNITIRQRALKQGLSLNEYGFTPVGEATAVPQINEEQDIYIALGLDPIPPELRENRGEFESALSHTLPRLVDLESLRGTFHCHTTASDGKNTLEEMARAAMDLGLSYLGIADHSKASFQARGLDASRLLNQIDEIRAFNATAPGIHIFAGSEVDILKDGSLDFPDDILSRLDYVVASVHNFFHLTEDVMTRRIIRAMENEHVTMLGHLTGRLLLKRDGYAVDHAKIIDCAAATRTIIELNCNPLRLDMDWRWWHRARDLGVLCSINPDAHATAQFRHLHFGVRLARKGWLRREDILNARPLADVRAFLKTPKAKR